LEIKCTGLYSETSLSESLDGGGKQEYGECPRKFAKAPLLKGGESDCGRIKKEEISYALGGNSPDWIGM